MEAKLEELKKKKSEKPADQHKPSKQENQQGVKEAELSEEEKAKLKSKPISSTPIPGTPWCVVWTRDKRVFFYNPSERVSLWERPAALLGRVDVDRLIKEVPAGAAANTESAKPADQLTAQKKKTETAASEPPTKKQK